MNLVELLVKNAGLYPDDTALIELIPEKKVREEITWSKFNEKADRIANALKDRGVGKGSKVIHLMMNSINWLEVYFGIIKTGAWVVPLNFRFTSSEIKYCTEIVEAEAMFLGEEFVEKVESVRSQLPTIKDFIFVGSDTPRGMEYYNEFVTNSRSQELGVRMDKNDACGLYFTSGTTGAPKPILLTHGNMESAALTENHSHHQTHEDNFVLIPPLYHAGALIHWFGTFLAGGKATILTGVKPKTVFQAIHDEKGTVVFLLVPWTQDILGALDRGELNKDDYDLSSWRLMYMGAQPIPPSVVRRWQEYFPDMQYDTTYGLSEATGPGCVNLGMENTHKAGAIGKAGFNWETRIVNDREEDVAQGETGELIVKGAGIMKEYYKNPEKTAETIKDDWLYTGDMARMDDDGFIYIVDRKKDVIITGGENIFPVEIEDALRENAKIKDVAVIGLPDDRLGEVIAAVIDPNPDVVLTEAEVHQFCEENLPRYKRPKRIVFDTVPRNPTGKIEKQKLRQKYTEQEESFKV